jgi:hypothetical protein
MIDEINFDDYFINKYNISSYLFKSENSSVKQITYKKDIQVEHVKIKNNGEILKIRGNTIHLFNYNYNFIIDFLNDLKRYIPDIRIMKKFYDDKNKIIKPIISMKNYVIKYNIKLTKENLNEILNDSLQKIANKSILIKSKKRRDNPRLKSNNLSIITIYGSIMIFLSGTMVISLGKNDLSFNDCLMKLIKISNNLLEKYH